MHRRFPVLPAAILAIACAAVMVLAPAGVARAQDGAGPPAAADGWSAAAGEPRTHLRVGAAERPPFATQSGDGGWQGIAVDLWRMVAEDLDLTYQIVRVPRHQLPEALAAGRLDVALAINATPAIESIVDVTTPMYISTLAVASRREVILWHVISNVLSVEFLQVMVSLSVLLLAVGAIVWFLERKQNSREFHHRPLLGLGDGFWWAGVTLTTIGYGDKAPKTLLGRAVAMVWMLIGLAVSAALTAAVVSATNVEGNTGLRIPQDLVDRRVGAVTNSSAARYLYAESIAVQEYPSLTQAMVALANEQIDAVADGYGAIRIATAGMGDSIVISTSPRDPQYISIGVRHPTNTREFERVEALRAAVLRRITGDGWWRLVERYLPSPSDRGSLMTGFD